MAQRKRGDAPAFHPHDALIKRTFSQREHAAGLLKAALAPEVVAVVRWSTLQMEKIHFVDRGLRGRYADLLFSAEMGHDHLYAYVLIEHQSKVEPLMIFRMGVYMWRHWEQLVRDEPTRRSLPPIIPILIHHSDTGWTAATAFEDIIAAPERARAALLRHIPRFAMRLVDVSRDPSGGLAEQALTDLGRFVLWCLSVAGDPKRLRSEIERFVTELNNLYAEPMDLDALISVLRYLVATHPKVGVTKIAKLLETTAKKGRKEVRMDVLDELREAGRREGAREGELRGRAQTLLELLAARFGAVPAKVKARVLAADERTLSRWSIRVLTAKTLTAVLDEPKPDVPSARKWRPAQKRTTVKPRAARG